MTKKNNVEAKLNKVLCEIREGLKMDGGDLELVSFQDGVVSVRFMGACVGCPMAAITYSEFIKKEIESKIPEIEEVKLV